MTGGEAMSGEWQYWLALSVACGLFLKLELVQQRVKKLDERVAREVERRGERRAKHVKCGLDGRPEQEQGKAE